MKFLSVFILCLVSLQQFVAGYYVVMNNNNNNSNNNNNNSNNNNDKSTTITTLDFPPECQDTASWPDLELQCGHCKVLATNMKGGHYTCENYCNSFGHTCTNAWEEVQDNCRVKSNENCQTRFDFTSDAICECHKLPELDKDLETVIGGLGNLTMLGEENSDGDSEFDDDTMMEKNEELQEKIDNSKCMQCILSYDPKCLQQCANGNPITCLDCVATHANNCLGNCGFDRMTDSQCERPYTVLSDAWRRVQPGVYHPTKHCDQPGSASYFTGITAGWYSFHFDGPAYIPTTAPLPENVKSRKTICGTNLVAWTEAPLPGLGEVPVDITIHFATDKPAYWSVPGKIVACYKDGEKVYLYNLPPVPRCTAAYCAIEM